MDELRRELEYAQEHFGKFTERSSEWPDLPLAVVLVLTEPRLQEVTAGVVGVTIDLGDGAPRVILGVA